MKAKCCNRRCKRNIEVSDPRLVGFTLCSKCEAKLQAEREEQESERKRVPEYIQRIIHGGIVFNVLAQYRSDGDGGYLQSMEAAPDLRDFDGPKGGAMISAWVQIEHRYGECPTEVIGQVPAGADITDVWRKWIKGRIAYLASPEHHNYMQEQNSLAAIDAEVENEMYGRENDSML